MKTRFYLNWLRLACLITIFTGVISLLAAHPATSKPWLMLFDVLQWPMDGNPGQFNQQSLALNAVLGGVMIGWGCLMLLLCSSKTHNHNINNALLISLFVWFVTDSSGSYIANIPGNILLNIGFLILFLIPLLKLRN